MTLQLEVLVEEPSMKLFVERILPRFDLPIDFAVHSFDSKDLLLKRVADRLQGYREWLRWQDLRILVILDRDDDDCVELKQRVESLVPEDLGIWRSNRMGSAGRVRVLVVCEELEAWYFGDAASLSRCYGTSPTLGRKARYRNPDQILGGTWEALERELRRVGKFESGLRKMEIADRMATEMSLDAANSSTSFGYFLRTLTDLEATA